MISLVFGSYVVSLFLIVMYVHDMIALHGKSVELDNVQRPSKNVTPSNSYSRSVTVDVKFPAPSGDAKSKELPSLPDNYMPVAPAVTETLDYPPSNFKAPRKAIELKRYLRRKHSPEGVKERKIKELSDLIMFRNSFALPEPILQAMIPYQMQRIRELEMELHNDTTEHTPPSS